MFLKWLARLIVVRIVFTAIDHFLLIFFDIIDDFEALDCLDLLTVFCDAALALKSGDIDLVDFAGASGEGVKLPGGETF